MRLQSFSGPGFFLPLGKRLHVPFKLRIQRRSFPTSHGTYHLFACVPFGPLGYIYCIGPVFSDMWCAFFGLCKRMRFLNKSLVYKYEMLVTFHAIWYVFTELSTPAWQKDLRDITFHIIQAMEEAKKE